MEANNVVALAGGTHSSTLLHESGSRPSTLHASSQTPVGYSPTVRTTQRCSRVSPTMWTGSSRARGSAISRSSIRRSST
jgi:hypothetical protein